MILRMDVEVQTGFRLSSRDSWKELDKFDGVFLAVGAQESIIPRISGNTASQVVGGLEFGKRLIRLNGQQAEWLWSEEEILRSMQPGSAGGLEQR
jgi:hypothetical protein